jgi:hypothetical protein
VVFLVRLYTQNGRLDGGPSFNTESPSPTTGLEQLCGTQGHGRVRVVLFEGNQDLQAVLVKKGARLRFVGVHRFGFHLRQTALGLRLLHRRQTSSAIAQFLPRALPMRP